NRNARIPSTMVALLEDGGKRSSGPGGGRLWALGRDDAVLARPFCLAQRSICARQEGFRGRRAGVGGDAVARGHGRRQSLLGGELGAQALREARRAVGVRLREDDAELLAADPGRDVDLPGAPLER